MSEVVRAVTEPCAEILPCDDISPPAVMLPSDVTLSFDLMLFVATILPAEMETDLLPVERFILVALITFAPSMSPSIVISRTPDRLPDTSFDPSNGFPQIVRIFLSLSAAMESLSVKATDGVTTVSLLTPTAGMGDNDMLSTQFSQVPFKAPYVL